MEDHEIRIRVNLFMIKCIFFGFVIGFVIGAVITHVAVAN